MDRLLERPSGRGPVAVPLGLIVVITLVDIHSPTDIHLGPLLVIAPALTASIAGPRLTALVGLLAVGAQILIAVLHGGLTTANHISQIIAITLLSALIVIFCRAGERRRQELNRVRSVSEAAQRVLLRPPPRRVGPLRVAWLYLAAGDEAKIGATCWRSPAPLTPAPAWSSETYAARASPPSVRRRSCSGRSARALTATLC